MRRQTISFRITGAGVERTVQTDERGTALAENLPVGRYTVAEQTNDAYVPTTEQTVTVTAGQTAQVRVIALSLLCQSSK